jgi:formamidopyrimidine-DNA glycosylase
MPELPEVETIKNVILAEIKGKTIKDIRVFRAKSLLTPQETFVSALVGETFIDVSRAGKFLIFHLTHGKVVISHLRMEGKYYLGHVSDPVEKHDILIYDFTDDSALRFNDVRKFGIVKLSDEAHYRSDPPVGLLGPEPWELNAQQLFASLQRKKKQPIKEALLDQKIISGLGNIYDDEVLFATHIHPLRSASSITCGEAGDIIREAQRILKIAIASGGSTIRSYHPKEGVDGSMQNKLLAYGHGNEPCPRCGFPLRKISVGGRGTVYCPRCQKLSDHPLIVGVTGPIASGKTTVSQYLERKGYLRIDADQIVAQLYKKPDIVSAVADILGASASKNGVLQRPFVAATIAADPKKKKELESFIHPLVYRETLCEIAAAKTKRIVLDVPLLIGGPFEKLCDLVIVILADEKVQATRLAARGKNPEEALLLNRHWPRGKAKKAAGLILNGNGSIEDLKKKLDSVKYL